VREQAELGSQHAHERMPLAAHEGHGGAQQGEAADPLGSLEAELEGEAPAHRVADDVSPLDAHGVHPADRRTAPPARWGLGRGR
jgi:hypothetical protein